MKNYTSNSVSDLDLKQTRLYASSKSNLNLNTPGNPTIFSTLVGMNPTVVNNNKTLVTINIHPKADPREPQERSESKSETKKKGWCPCGSAQ